MKRGELQRKAPLRSQNQPLSRSAGLKRTNGPARRPSRQKGVMRPETRRKALARDGGRCRCCGLRATEVHHIFKRERWPQLADWLDNLISVCSKCHARHETAFWRIDRDVVEAQAKKVLDRCRSTGEGHLPSMQSYLNRSYRHPA